MPKFKKAEIIRSTSSRGDYVKFYVWNVQKNDLERKRVYIPSKYKTDLEKEAFLKDRKKQINKLLIKGFHIDTERIKIKVEEKAKKERVKELKKEPIEIRRAIDKLVTLREAKKYHKRGISFFKNTMLQFVEWGEKQKQPIRFINDITFKIVQEYQMYLLTDLKNKSKTHNNSLGVISAFYNDCIDQEWVKGENPLEKFDNLPTDYGTKNKPYTNEEVAEMKKYILENDPYLWTIISFIYYSFMRPVELRRLKVGDIDLKQNIIRIAVEQSKTKRYDIIPIAPALLIIITKMNLEQYPNDYFLFNGRKKPSNTQMGENYMSKHFKKVKKYFGFDNDPDYTLYGFKHTACVNWYKAEKDIIKIQKMSRHTTVKTTERYLKSMGLLEDKNAVSMLPEI
ncbi:tyrosine-type recombinase/integrase [Aquimarina mytili]|uniref:Tyrosine-type recombinase/integrase n=1 Tax=Aquimarina mytili TaxID=874423 RepID=A0A936ZTD4_9FLAO|nr:site-specific integrase [Aquimarina mytili]MBL0684333.1 tyrosine-type recombinase/integrase [Aquimarina mytili]